MRLHIRAAHHDLAVAPKGEAGVTALEHDLVGALEHHPSSINAGLVGLFGGGGSRDGRHGLALRPHEELLERRRCRTGLEDAEHNGTVHIALFKHEDDGPAGRRGRGDRQRVQNDGRTSAH